MDVRFPAVAGYFYPANKEELLEKIKKCFLSELGPKKLPPKSKSGDIIVAGIVPHAGYDFSGPCAAHFYYGASSRKVDTVIILGTNHTGLGPDLATLITYKWMTPLGIVNTDIDFGKELIERGLVYESYEAHKYEHSIEVQLPFLQYIYKNFKIIPIVIKAADYSLIKDLAREIKEISEEMNKKILVIASSDLNHVGPAYGYFPFEERENFDIKNLLKNYDMNFIKTIMQLDTKKFLKMVVDYGATICGFYAIAIVMEYAKLQNAKAQLLCYYNSAYIYPDTNTVGYCSISFSKKNQKETNF